jgi:hypothetical protein
MGIRAFLKDAFEDMKLYRIIQETPVDYGPFTSAIEEWPRRCDWCGEIAAWYSRHVHNREVNTGIWAIPYRCRACMELHWRDEVPEFILLHPKALKGADYGNGS